MTYPTIDVERYRPTKRGAWAKASRSRTSAGFTSDQRAAIIRQLITEAQSERKSRRGR